MKNIKTTLLGIAICISQLYSFKANSQCSWATQISDGFEYSTAIPYIIPGATYQTVPQTYAAHTGTKSAYLNMVNCAGGVGICVGDTFYSRPIQVCTTDTLRITAFFTTTFTGTLQCGINVLIADANGTLIYGSAMVPSYSPTWDQFNSGTFVPPTSTIYFILTTNVDGGSGNDLSMDDFLIEKCSEVTYNMGSDTTVCSTQSVTLDAGTGFSNYLWNNGATTQTIVASTTLPGPVYQYWIVQVTSGAGCNYDDSVWVIFNNCAGINDLYNESSISVYPNPAVSDLNIHFDNKQAGNYYFILRDITGKEVTKIKLENDNESISLNSVRSSGLYFYSIEKENEVVKYGKVVLQ